MDQTNISFFIPAFNCAGTIRETVESIFDGNFKDGDEVVIVNDSSTDSTPAILNELQAAYPAIKVFNHPRNKGGGAARNSAVEQAAFDLLFCLDSDNILAPNSVDKLKKFLLRERADAACFGQLHYFRQDKSRVEKQWHFQPGIFSLTNHLATYESPSASGNYMFTKQSWGIAGGYPEFAGALDAWGFGLRQLATGSKMAVSPEGFYYHRFGHQSYWMRDAKNNHSLQALRVLIPFLDLLKQESVDYIFSPEGRLVWLDQLNRRPLLLKNTSSARMHSRYGFLDFVKDFMPPMLVRAGKKLKKIINY
jgi:glycosyltransferase involved in cell wall biosynthesis